MNQLLFVICIAILMLFALTVYLRKWIVRTFKKLNQCIYSLGEGDFTTEICIPQSHDKIEEIYTALDIMKNNLKSLVNNIVDTTKVLQGQSNSLKDTSEAFLSASSRIAIAMNETAIGNDTQTQKMIRKVILEQRLIPLPLYQLNELVVELAKNTKVFKI